MKKIIRLFILSVITTITLLSVYANTAKTEHHIYAANRDAGKYVALTFDDGPHPKYTPEILDILKENDAKATFFVIGKNAKNYPELILREKEEGHEIGNHTYSHPDMKGISVDKAVEEIMLTQETISEITGVRPVLFRAPGGVFSNELVLMLENIECKPVLWSWKQDTKDWSLPSVKTVVNTVLNNINDGDIILFHDYNMKGSPTPEALKIILPKLKEMGYNFVTVSELIELNNQDK